MEHHFDVDHAVEFGIEEAIVIYNFRFWLLQNKANHRNVKKIEIEGKKVERYFTYNSAKALSELFPYLNPKQIYRVMESLEKKGVLIKKYFNSNTYNRTSWYCFKDENRFLKVGNAIPENDKSNSRKQEMEIPKSGNHDTDNKPDIKPDNKNIPTLSEQLKELAEKNGLTYSINTREQNLFQNKLSMEMGLTNDKILDQANRFFDIVKRDQKQTWIHSFSFGFKFLQFNWDKIDAWHNANKSNVVKFIQPTEKKAPAKFSDNDLNSLKEFLA